MFELSRKKQQQARAAKPVQTLDELAANLGMNNLVEPTTLVEIHNAIRETSGNWARKVNPKGEGEKVYAYDAMRVLQEVYHTWARLYKVVESSRNKELSASLGLSK